jgi:transposase
VGRIAERIEAGEGVEARSRGAPIGSGALPSALGDLAIEILKAQPDLFLQEVAVELYDITGMSVFVCTAALVFTLCPGWEVSVTTIRKWIKERGWSLKRCASFSLGKYSLANRRHAAYYLRYIHSISRTKQHYLDEVMVSSRELAGRAHAWAPLGERTLFNTRLPQAYKQSTIALTTYVDPHDPNDNRTPFVWCTTNDTTYSEDVVTFVANVVLSGNVFNPGDVLVMDNCRTHWGDTETVLRAILGSVGVNLVYLPPYSPELNPIELVFNYFKDYLRRNCPERHTSSRARAAMREAFSSVSAELVRRCYRKCCLLS